MSTIPPITGSTTPARVEKNSKLIDIADKENEQIDAILAKVKPASEH